MAFRLSREHINLVLKLELLLRFYSPKRDGQAPSHLRIRILALELETCSEGRVHSAVCGRTDRLGTILMWAYPRSIHEGT